MNDSSCVSSGRSGRNASVERSDEVSTSCRQTMCGSGVIAAMARAMARFPVRVDARPRRACPK
jgi:hypothetical protein